MMRIHILLKLRLMRLTMRKEMTLTKVNLHTDQCERTRVKGKKISDPEMWAKKYAWVEPHFQLSSKQRLTWVIHGRKSVRGLRSYWWNRNRITRISNLNWTWRKIILRSWKSQNNRFRMNLRSIRKIIVIMNSRRSVRDLRARYSKLRVRFVQWRESRMRWRIGWSRRIGIWKNRWSRLLRNWRNLIWIWDNCHCWRRDVLGLSSWSIRVLIKRMRIKHWKRLLVNRRRPFNNMKTKSNTSNTNLTWTLNTTKNETKNSNTGTTNSYSM